VYYRCGNTCHLHWNNKFDIIINIEMVFAIWDIKIVKEMAVEANRNLRKTPHITPSLVKCSELKTVSV